MVGIEQGMPEPGELGSIPVTVITRARGDQPQLGVWQQTQSAFAQRLKKGRYVVAQNSGHFIYRDEEDLVLQEIRAVVHNYQQQR